MAYSNKSYFPSQTVSDAEKLSYDYGLKVAKAIETEWFNDDRSLNKYRSNQNNFHNLRLYARGEQSIQKYKDELSINGDLSYLNLDWKPVPIIPKFVDIVVNGIADRMYDIRAYSQDPFGVTKRTEYMESILMDMRTKDLNDYVEKEFGIELWEHDPKRLPETEEELKLHMQLNYKQSVELAEEQALNVLFNGSNYELIKKRFYYDLTVLGIGATKTSFNTSEGVVIDYVDPADLVYSYTESPYFDDIYYVGEVKHIPINELVKQFPYLSHDELQEIVKNKNYQTNYHGGSMHYKDIDNNKVQVLYFNYKTYMNEVYKLKETGSGASKIILKDDNFNPPKDKEGNFAKLQRNVEVLYDGALILGTDKLLKWEMATNMMRPKSDFTKVKMNYSIVAPRMYKGKIESLVQRITGFADMIQLTHLKLQQVMSRMVPDGVYLDADGLAEIDLGNGTNYSPQEALNMFFQTGSVIGRSLTQDGDMNPGKVPITELQSGSGGNKLQSLIGTYNYYLQMIRDVTGLNEARDASVPDKNALVGVQKLAAANSNTATRHILQSGLFLTAETAECLSLRISDEEEKQLLENNIQVALSKENIELEDAIDIREIKNIRLANQLLKIRRKKKIEKDQQIAQENIKAQADANAQAQQQAAEMELQKQQALTQGKAQLEEIEAKLELQKLQQEAALKKELMDHEFQLNMQLKQMELDTLKQKETNKEDRKDERTRIQASQQSELIEQRNQNAPPKNFESKNNDSLTGDFDLGMFEPR